AVELDNPQLALRRGPDGTLSLDLGSLAEMTDDASTAAAPAPDGNPLPALLAVLAQPPATDRASASGWLSQIRRVRIHDAVLSVQDSGLGLTLRAPRAEIDLTRRPQGGVDGSIDLSLAAGDTEARLTATAALSAGATETRVSARLSPIIPAALAGQSPHLSALVALNAPVASEATLVLGPDLGVRQLHATLRADPGTLKIGAGNTSLLDATMEVSGTPDAVVLDSGRLSVRARAGGPVVTVTGKGTLRRDAGRFDAALSLGLDQADFADLPALWPEGLSDGARRWIIDNVTTGVARNAQIDLGVSGDDTFTSVAVTHASGTLEAAGLTASWLRPVPPLDQGRARVRIVDPDTLEIAVQSARQVVRGSSNGLTVTGGTMRITGLSRPDQIGEIHADIAGTLADVVTLLRDPRLRLLDRHPINFSDPTGDVTGSVAVTLPLDSRLRIEDVAIRATAHVQNTHLGGVAAGRDLDRGTLDLTAGNDGMAVKGQALIAGIQTSLNGTMDFRAGGPNQVVQRVWISGRPTAAQLATAGLDATAVLSGPIDAKAEV